MYNTKNNAIKLNGFNEDVNQLTHTGEILRRRDGNYCFSCYHCDEYFDLIHEIIAHMNTVLEGEAHTKVQSKLEALSSTEFVDVSVSIKLKGELVEDYVTDISAEDDIDEHVKATKSSVVIKRKLNAISEASVTKRTKSKHSAYQGPAIPSSNKSEANVHCDDQINVRADLIKCCWCSETFDDFGSVQNHLTDDHNKKNSDVYSCYQCRLFFKNLKLLSDHILSHHGPDEHEQFQLETDYQENIKPIQWVVCQLWSKGSRSFDAHTKEAHKMYRILQCYVCGIYKKKPSGLLDHLKVHDRFRKYRCYECDNVQPKITNPNDFRSHKCVLCGVWFLNHATIRKHLTDVHGQDQIYDCTICDDFTYKTELDLKMHGIEVHEVPSEYECEICGKHCKSIQSLSEHRKSHHSTACNTNVCSICGSKFRRKDYLLRHIKSHSVSNKNFKCYICSKEFQSNGYLKNHIKRHTEKKMHQCDVCGSFFLLAGLLRKHMKEHEGEVWKCAQCPKEFSNKSKLTAHEKTWLHQKFIH